jgi:hypothetical protein
MNENFQDTYTTKLGTEFTFRFEFKDGNYEVQILDQPSYGERDDNLHVTHRLKTDDGFKICWTGSTPTATEAKRIAGLWSDLTERYVLNGELFPNI